ncbi:MAG TPA: NAD(P)/FAD-dependent oxidoreductase [Balneolales bacterium]|nr:NAD(P)/FAD-dependent oxidoreductase [Balneolales bacterium]
MTKREHVVIIGGGFGGINCARILRKSNLHVTIIDRNNHHLFQPLLYQVATAALSAGDIATPIRAVFSKQNNIDVLLGEVIDIFTDRRKIRLKDNRELTYDYLILAPGSRYNYFGNDQWSRHAPGLKSLADALNIRERILISLEKAEQLQNPTHQQPYLNFVIIGGGPTGVEMAGAISEIVKRNMMRDYHYIRPEQSKIYLVEATSGILNGFSNQLSRRAQADLEKMGIDILLNNPVTDVTSDGVALNDRFIKTTNIIWAAGVTASPLLDKLAAEKDRNGRIIVNSDLTVPGNPDIFVIGDAAHFVEEGKDQPLPALAPVAIQEGKYIGKLLKRRTPRHKRKPFKYIDKGTMATIGRAKAVAEIKNLRITGFPAWLAWSFIHIFYLIDFRNRFRVMLEWSWYYLTFRRGVRLITDRESIHWEKVKNG